MAINLTIPLIHLLITGIYCISTVSKVSVKTGASVSVPCLYRPQYRDNVKYLCKWYGWSSCSYAVKTNTQLSSEYSISDDKDKNIFTVTLKQINKYADYRCAVEIARAYDDGSDFRLSVTRGIPSLYVDSQEVTGFIGGNTTINCRYRTSGRMKWCKLGSTCVTEGSGSIDGTSVTMNTRADNVFSVIMTDLRPESSGWYYCVRGDFQMPVHLTVAVKPAVTTTHNMGPILFTMSMQRTKAFLGVLTSNPVTVVGENATSTKEDNSSESNMPRLKKHLVPLFVMTVAVALFIWFKVRSKCANSATSEQSEDEVTYTHVRFRRKLSSQTFHGDNDTEVVYSSVVRRQ